MTHVHILLATHNGERFLSDQLRSLQSQSMRDWTLLVMDDGSLDRSREIAMTFAQQDPRVRVLEKPIEAPPGAVGTFGALARESLRGGADYVFFCDQDDVWHTDKIAVLLQALGQLEGEERIPSLVHHDLEVVDEQLAPLHGSFWSQMKLDPGTERHPERLLSRNEVTGCALACNRALLELALPIPAEAMMHDWWLALCAAWFGRLRAHSDTLVSYRQHGGNVLGARGFWHGLNPFTNWRASWTRGDEEFFGTVRQAEVFHVRYGARLASDTPRGRALDLYRRIPALPRGRRIQALRDARAWRRHWLLDSVLALRVLLLPAGER